MIESLHLGIFNANTLYREDSGYTTDGSVVKLYQRWEAYFENVDLCSPVVTGKESGSVDVGSAFHIVSLTQWRNPWTLRTLELPILLRDIWRAFDDRHQEWDFVLIPTTNIFGQAVYAVASVFDVPVVVYLRGNVTNEVLGGHEGVARVVATLWIQYLDYAVNHIVRDSAVLTAGDELKREYEALAGRIESIVPSLVNRDDIVTPDTRIYPDNDDPIRLLYLGRLVEYKRVQDVLAAMAELRSRPRAYELEIVGDGPYREALERTADDLGIAEDVTFTGYVSHENVYDAYDRADIFVLPSSSEGSPKTVPEALARGCPIVASAVGNLPSLLANETGITYNPGDIDALVDALDQLGTDEEYWKTLVRRSVARASQFTAETHVQAIENVLSDTYPELGDF
ncbi:glycosyltransferase family 4 protein [Haloarcula amylolytica]|uniref:Group 1 glycosyl transferase n=1 Tax=Haloarcula amylolytica JCM 13557 TaxID=1227452 RepID=M0K557_9EURY|nr:glycosyltransferase family 4 protein [Haloarcula amylolytica]EMA15953.1 group 1 glycosyl transferase [Haloarcula amylolytica JCM 13557]